MNKTLLTIMLYISVLGVISFIALKFIKHSPPSLQHISPSPTQNAPEATGSTNIVYCKLSDLAGIVSFEGAAGSTYGALGIKNTSSQACQIIGNNFVMVAHEAQNVSVQQQESPGSDLMSLSPGQTVYTKIRYPNGAQCNGPTKQSNVTLAYKISPDESLIFKTGDGKTVQPIQVCTDAKLTTVQVWSISTKQ
jgi:hypothetical protein